MHIFCIKFHTFYQDMSNFQCIDSSFQNKYRSLWQMYLLISWLIWISRCKYDLQIIELPCACEHLLSDYCKVIRNNGMWNSPPICSLLDKQFQQLKGLQLNIKHPMSARVNGRAWKLILRLCRYDSFINPFLMGWSTHFSLPGYFQNAIMS